MPFDSLREFMSHLEARGRLVRAREPVSPVLEITEIHTRLLAEKGPAVLFEQVEGSGMPVLTNLFGTVERVAWGMDREPQGLRELGRTLAFFKQPVPPESLGQAWEMLPLVKAALAMKPRTVGRAPCQEVVLRGADIDLGRLPIQTCWPGEPAPLITWPLVVTKGPTTAREDAFNLGIYRMQVRPRPDADALAQAPRRGPAPPPLEGEAHRAAARGRRHRRRPWHDPGGRDAGAGHHVGVPVRGPPARPQGRARGLRHASRSRCRPRPRSCWRAMSAWTSTARRPVRRPYGLLQCRGAVPGLPVSAITMRRDPIYLSTFTGRPPDEPSVLGEALNEVFMPLFQQQFPEIVDFWLPPEGCSYRMAVVSIRKAYPGHAKRVMMGVWSYLRQFMYTKLVIVVDDDIDARDWKDVVWALSTRVDASRDLTVIDNTPIDYLDFASPEMGLGGKLGMDATDKWPPETKREWGRKIRMADDVVEKVTAKWDRYGLPGAGKPIWK